jgi:hypothetical protein
MPTHAVDAVADALASTPTHLYWLDATLAVMRQPKAGGARDTLASMADRGIHIYVDATRVFWEEAAMSSKSVYSMPLDASSGHTRLAPNVVAWTVGVDRVFYGSTQGRIESVPKSGGAPTVVADGLVTGPMAADETGVYWYDGRTDAGVAGLSKFTLASSSQGAFADSMLVRYLLSDGAHVVWVDEPSYFKPAAIRWTSPAAGAASTIASAQPFLLGLTADATTAYWLTGGPTGSMGPVDVVAAPFDGGPLRKLACNIRTPRDMTVDDEAVYVSSYEGVVWKVAKTPP